ELVNPVPHNRVRLSAANFHQRPRARDRAANFFQHTVDELGIAVFGNVFHGLESGIRNRLSAFPFALYSRDGGDLPKIFSGSISSSKFTISRKVSSDARASSSLKRLMAKPT